MEGSCRALLNGSAYTLRPGDLLLASHGSRYELIYGEPQQKDVYSSDFFLMIDPNDDWVAAWYTRMEAITKLQIGFDERLIGLWKQISYEKRRLRDSDKNIMGYLTRAMLLHLERMIVGGGGTNRQGQSIANQMKQFIELNVGNPLTLHEIAGSVGLSVSRASELFKLAFNQSVMGYYSDARLMLAKERILVGGMTLEKIAYLCGFSTYNQFNRSFRSRFGISPSQYKKQIHS
jgi:AraC family transcriptional regulator of arabinose operon